MNNQFDLTTSTIDFFKTHRKCADPQGYMFKVTTPTNNSDTVGVGAVLSEIFNKRLTPPGLLKFNHAVKKHWMSKFIPRT